MTILTGSVYLGIPGIDMQIIKIWETVIKPK